MKFSLATKFTIGVAAVSVIVLGILFWNSERIILASHADSFIQFATDEGAALAEYLAPNMHNSDITELNKKLEFLAKEKEIEYIHVQDLLELPHIVLGVKPDEVDVTYEDAFDGVLDMVFPIMRNGEMIGTLFVGFSSENVAMFIKRMRLQNLAISFAGIALLVIFVMFHSRYLVRNIKNIEAGAKAIQQGKAYTPITYFGSDESTALAKEFNRLYQHLDESNAALDKEHNALLRETRRLEAMIDGVSAVVWEAEGFIDQLTYVSKGVKQLLGYSASEWLERGFVERAVYSKDLERLRETFDHHCRYPGTFSIDFRLVKPSGELVWVRGVNDVEITENDEVIIRGVIVDITEQKHFENHIVHMAEHDVLTGLVNRGRFQEELNRQLEFTQRYGNLCALLFIDLDQFKYVNDTFGHQAGDDLLVLVSKCLMKVLRKTDVLGRLGGDEFGVVLPNIKEQEAELVSAGLLKAIKASTLETDGRFSTVSASIGIVYFSGPGISSGELLAKADAAMYVAKKQGRNCFHLYNNEDDELQSTKDKMSWESKIRTALRYDSFRLFYQPIINLMSGNIEHYEALLRLPDENSNELFMPDQFMEVAHHFGSIRDIDHWVLNNAIKSLGEINQNRPSMIMAINLSGRHFGSNEVLDLVHSALEEYQVDPRQIIFEITETSAVENMVQAKQFIESLSAMGCKFALDDFGVGFSTFHYLKNLPVDFIKIDGSFIQDLNKDESDRVFVKAMVDMAHGLGISCIAEYVDNEAVVTILREMGIEFAQGYQFAKPAEQLLPEDKIAMQQYSFDLEHKEPWDYSL